jgi:hypothetical protein
MAKSRKTSRSSAHKSPKVKSKSKPKRSSKAALAKAAETTPAANRHHGLLEQLGLALPQPPDDDAIVTDILAGFTTQLREAFAGPIASSNAHVAALVRDGELDLAKEESAHAESLQELLDRELQDFESPATRQELLEWVRDKRRDADDAPTAAECEASEAVLALRQRIEELTEAQFRLSETEQAVLDYIRSKDRARLKEIAKAVHRTRARVKHIIPKLMAYHGVTHDGPSWSGYYIDPKFVRQPLQIK